MESHNQEKDDVFVKQARKRFYEEAFEGMQVVTCKDCHCLLPSAANGNVEDIKFVKIVAAINNKEQENQILGFHDMRDFLCNYNDNDPHLNYLLTKYGVVPVCIQFLKTKMWAFSALGTLNTIFSKYCGQINCALAYNAVPDIIYFLRFPSQKLVSQAVLALFHISGEGFKACEVLVQNATLDWAFKLLCSDIPITSQRHVVMLVRNIIQHTSLEFDQYKHLLALMTQMLNNGDEYVNQFICWTISYLTDSNSKSIDIVLAFGGLTKLCNLLDSYNADIVVPALRCLTNIALGSHCQYEAAMNSSFLKKLAQLLYHPNKIIVEMAIWDISAIVKKEKDSIERFFQSGIISELLFFKYNKELQKEWALVVHYLFINSTEEQRTILTEIYGLYEAGKFSMKDEEADPNRN